MNLQDFQICLMEEAKKAGFQECEVYFKGSENFEVLILEGETSHYETSDSVGISFRGVYLGKMGYSYTEQLEECSIPLLIEQAKENAEIMGEETKEGVYEGSESYPEISCYEPELEQLSVQEKIEAAKKMEQAALHQHDSVAAIDYCALRVSKINVSIVNSKGLHLDFTKNNAAADVCAIAQGNGDVKTGSHYWTGNHWREFHPEEVGSMAAQKAASHLGAYSIDSGDYHVLLKNHVAAELLSIFCVVFYGENVKRGFSLLKGKLHERIASPKVTLRDDGLLESCTGSYPFDSEGVACQNKAVVQNGRLELFLYNRKTAKAMGTKSTGNGFRPLFRVPIGTACTNFYFAPGGKTPRTMIAQLGEGLFITEISGLHAGANTISGDFALSAEGFWIERGQISRPVEQITISGNFYHLLKNIEEVGNDLIFTMPGSNGTMGAPTVMVRKMSISGM